MATKVKPSRLNITGTPQAGDVPMYVDANSFQWGTGGSSVTVVDNLNSQSSTDALSANQGYILNNKIADLFGLGKFLSVWDATTGQPDSFPLQTPYTYSTGDYYLVGTVSSATPPVNYRPNGSSYTGTASSTPETDELETGDIYIYDGSVWLLQSNHGKTVSFANLAGDAMDNANLSGYINVKAFYLSSTSDLTTAQAAFEWQNGGKTAIVVYSNKPYAFSFYNTAQMDFACLFYREQLEATNNKTSLVRDVITFSVTGGTTVSSISANAWNNVIASVLKTDTDYATPYTPQYNGSPATKKYVDDHGVPSGGNNGDVLTNVSGTPTWQAISGGHDYSWNTLTGTTLSITGTNYRNQISTSSNLTVSAGTGLTPGMEYILRVVNSDSSNAITMTWDSVAYTIPAGGEINFKFISLTATTLDFDGPRIVATTPASFDSGKIYFEI